MRQLEVVELIASENFPDERVIKACGTEFMNKYAEGYPEKKSVERFKSMFPDYIHTGNIGRYYGGCDCVDMLELYTRYLFQRLFNTDYHVNVQPHSGSQANEAAYGLRREIFLCRANLSPWYERGGMEPADENDKPVYEGRCNLGAISLHFPMIVAKAQQENKDYYEVLTYYLDLCRAIHKRTFSYLSHKKAGTNPLAFCQGGFLNGRLDPEQELGEDFLRPMTMSFGITALNEASVLYCGKSIAEDNTFAIDTLKFINTYTDKFKKEDGILYALYGTPAESLCGLQIEQFRKKYGIIKGVSDRPYTSNSFHCGVWEDISPIQKQDIEYPMFHLCNGGNIQYCRYTTDYNTEAMKTLIRRAMKMGFYEGINMQLDYCEDCGASFIDKDECPKCGSTNITRIERMNGYLGYSKVKGRTMYADHKLAEFAERKSM